MLPKYLYRGDKQGNPTMPEQCYSGLYTKLLQNGNPAYITINGINQAINYHVSPENAEQRLFYDTSHFLSFTESKEKAKWYASDKIYDGFNEEELEYPERHYIFTFDLNKTKNEQITKNVYKVSYKCYGNFCEICQGDGIHNIIVLDVVSILKDNPAYMTNKNALIKAENNKERLVLPYDYKSELGGFSARISPADFWSFEYFGLFPDNE